MKVADLRNAFAAGRPLVQQWMDISIQMAALRDDCREKGIEWQQVKSLLKAQMLDEAEGTTKRVDAIIEKADIATAYADALGLGGSEKNISRDAPQQAPEAPQKPVRTISPDPAPPTKTASQLQVSVALARAGIDPFEMPDIPAYLDRRAT